MTTTTEPKATVPNAAIRARRADADVKVRRVADAVKRMVRQGVPISRARIAAQADVSRTFLYENAAARDLVDAALVRTTTAQSEAARRQDAAQDANWRQRALNAEQALKAARKDVSGLKAAVADLMGQLRDPDGTWVEDDRAELRAQNDRLRQEVHDLRRGRADAERALDASRATVRRLRQNNVEELFPDGPRPPGVHLTAVRTDDTSIHPTPTEETE